MQTQIKEKLGYEVTLSTNKVVITLKKDIPKANTIHLKIALETYKVDNTSKYLSSKIFKLKTSSYLNVCYSSSHLKIQKLE